MLSQVPVHTKKIGLKLNKRLILKIVKILI